MKPSALPRVQGPMLRCTALSVLALATLLSASARADDCMGTSVVLVRAEGAPADIRVALDRNRRRWELHDGNRTHALSAIPEHAHLVVLVSRDGTVAVVRSSAGHELTDRVLIYRRDGHLLSRHDLEDLLAPAVVQSISRSISHIEWVRSWRFTGRREIELQPHSGPAIRLPLR